MKPAQLLGLGVSAVCMSACAGTTAHPTGVLTVTPQVCAGAPSNVTHIVLDQTNYED